MRPSSTGTTLSLMALAELQKLVPQHFSSPGGRMGISPTLTSFGWGVTQRLVDIQPRTEKVLLSTIAVDDKVTVLLEDNQLLKKRSNKEHWKAAVTHAWGLTIHTEAAVLDSHTLYRHATDRTLRNAADTLQAIFCMYIRVWNRTGDIYETQSLLVQLSIGKMAQQY